MKKIAAFLLLTVVLCLASCTSGVRSSLMGEWTLTKVNGACLEQYAAAMGRAVSDVAVNYTFYEDRVVENTADGEKELSLEWGKDGVTTQAAEFFAYSEEMDVLVVEDGQNVRIYTRGSYEFNEPYQS